MIPLLAEADAGTIGLLVQSLTALLLLALTAMQLFRGASGREAERQIEPTALHAITSELKTQTITLNKLDRESGETKKAVESVASEVSELKKIQRDDVDKMHTRVGGISRELSATAARVEGLERREQKS